LGIEIAKLTPDIVGRRLGKNFYSANGNLLLRKGIELNDKYYHFFEEQGYNSIFLLSKDPEAPSGPHLSVISDRLMTASPVRLKKIFNQLKIEGTGKIYGAKGELLDLAKTILTNIDFRATKIPHVLDIKRHQDYLYQHSINVAVYSTLIGRKLDYQEKQLYNLVIASLLHDFGMVFVDHEIVNKTSALEPGEFELVKEHTVKGFSYLVRNCSFDGLSTIASVQHHERFDGKGYPNSLTANRIHEYSRIITVTDFFDAWTSDRPHRRLNSIDDAVGFLQSNQSKIFDPKIVDYFISMFK
jgi:HD-GYP domain-containing protein (c-di-GMP phosphodiesterase class II)